MQVVVTVEARLHRTPDGVYWCDNQFPFPYEFWTRYLSAFENVLVAARVQDVSAAQSNWKKVEGEQVAVYPLPFYLGPLGYVKNFLRLHSAIKKLLNSNNAFILRVGSPIADILQPKLVSRDIKYGVEVVGDPWDTFSPGSVNHPLRIFFRRWFTYKLKNQCKKAYVASYVTERMLQKRYPAPKAKLTIAASSITLVDEAIASGPKTYAGKNEYKLIVVGSLEDQRKGVDVLLRALRLVMDKSPMNVSLKVVGEGRKKAELIALTKELGLEEFVEFIGALPAGEKVRAQFSTADIFVLPSRAEGLPRAMIEAMAQGMFCIGSAIAGIPELIDSRWLCESGNSQDLSLRILDALAHPQIMQEEARKNLEKAKSYHISILSERRKSLYKTLRQGVRV